MGKTLKRKNTSQKKNRSRVSSMNMRSEVRNGSLDLAPKVRKNKVIKERDSEMFNFDDLDQDYFELEKITSFLRTSLKSKNLKEFIKSNQVVFDNFIDRVDSGKWMGIDLRSMHGFFIKCFKNKVLGLTQAAGFQADQVVHSDDHEHVLPVLRGQPRPLDQAHRRLLLRGQGTQPR